MLFVCGLFSCMQVILKMLANLLASTQESKANTTQATIHQKHKELTTQNEHKSSFVASYDFWPGTEWAYYQDSKSKEVNK